MTSHFHSNLTASGEGAAADLLLCIRSIRDDREFIAKVAELHGLKLVDLRSPFRHRRLMEVRTLCAALLKARGQTFGEIGRLVCDREESSVRGQARQFFDREMRDPWFTMCWRVLAPESVAHVASYEEMMRIVGAEWWTGTDELGDPWLCEAAE